MRKSSWIGLGACAVLLALVGMAYRMSRAEPETLTRARAEAILLQMQDAVRHKRVDTILERITLPPGETRIANLTPDQLRLLLARAFREAGKLRADCANVTFDPIGADYLLAFDLTVFNELPGMVAEDYRGRVTLRLRRMPVPRAFGLLSADQWQIVAADSTGPDLAAFAEGVGSP